MNKLKQYKNNTMSLRNSIVYSHTLDTNTNTNTNHNINRSK